MSVQPFWNSSQFFSQLAQSHCRIEFLKWSQSINIRYVNDVWKRFEKFIYSPSETVLNLKNLKIQTLPSEMFKLEPFVTRLHEVVLDQSHVKFIPYELSHAINLKRIAITGIHGCYIPDELRSKLQVDKKVYEEDGELAVAAICHQWVEKGGPDEQRGEIAQKILRYIEEQDVRNELDLSYLTSQDLPEVFHHSKFTKHLRYLNLKGMNLRELPASLFNLKALQDLKLDQNQLECLPEQFHILKNLRVLDVARNPLKKLPDHLQLLSRLSHLDFSHTLINEIPDYLAQLKKLQFLGAKTHYIKALPSSLRELSSLKEIDVCLELRNESPCLKENAEDMLGEILARGGVRRSAKGYLQTMSSAKKETLIAWLTQLKKACENHEAFSEVVKKSFYFSVCKVLLKAEEDKEFSEFFYRRMHESLCGCVYEILLSLMDMTFHSLHSKLEVEEPVAVYRYYQRTYPIDALLRVADEKIKHELEEKKHTLPFLDETELLHIIARAEIKLRYFVHLHEEYQLPPELSWVKCLDLPPLSQNDLVHAKEYVQGEKLVKSKFYDYLHENQKWQDVLYCYFNKEMKMLEQVKPSSNCEQERLKRQKQLSILTNKILTVSGVTP